MQKKLKDTEQQMSQQQFTIKNSQTKLDKYMKVDAPQHFKKIEDRVKRAEHDIKENQKKLSKELNELSIELSEKFEEAQENLDNVKAELEKESKGLDELVKKIDEKFTDELRQTKVTIRENEKAADDSWDMMDVRVKKIDTTVAEFTAGMQQGIQALSGAIEKVKKGTKKDIKDFEVKVDEKIGKVKTELKIVKEEAVKAAKKAAESASFRVADPADEDASPAFVPRSEQESVATKSPEKEAEKPEEPKQDTKDPSKEKEEDETKSEGLDLNIMALGGNTGMSSEDKEEIFKAIA